MNKKSQKERSAFFKTIIIGADFSKHSKKVLKNAQDMAKKWPVKLVLAHVAGIETLSLYPYGYPSPSAMPGSEEMAKELIKFYKLEKAKNIQVVVQVGDPVSGLIKIAKKFNKPLIFVGQTSKGVFSRLALGSVSKSLALKSPVPVWIQ